MSNYQNPAHLIRCYKVYKNVRLHLKKYNIIGYIKGQPPDIFFNSDLLDYLDSIQQVTPQPPTENENERRNIS